MIEERIDQVQFLAEEPAELVHAVEHVLEAPQAAPHLARGEPGRERARLLREVPGDGAEQRILAVRIAIDRVPRRRRIVDLDKRQLRHRERRHLDVDQQNRVTVLVGGPHLDPRPRLVRGRRDADEPFAAGVRERLAVDP